ncbi:hypothetical protein PGH12_15735 [Chryseobacterium wangxinyae]|uniref:hypothetical protein n=1 Tax=Chryseobacterium sp. CY350 TaxID=2997336 RepID=UPI00226FD6A3|nr:hypothetical protein [Chryseobacterium sp. CY350]MCY0977816.1 hypothetical protein [Chryseobacterium sp. CY350]WBZ94904.1 hypothetical protein PGH12_15735 [Chryseobacterium sp. CY350]
MKSKLFIFFCLIILNFGCSQSSKSQGSFTAQVPLEKQITYALQLNMRLPFELYINDIKASYNYVGTNVGVDLNPYLLGNGKCKIRIKIFPAFKAGKTEIPLDDLENSTVLFGKYIMDKEKNDIHSYNINDFTKLDYKLPNKPVASFEQEWEVDIKELPYELEGWSKGQDLRKFDKKVLEQKVVSYYKNLWNILNDGNSEKYQQLWKYADQDLIKYNYESVNTYEKAEINNENDIKKCKNMMIPFEDYEMKIYADGKLITLERKTNTKDFNNESPLDIKSWSPLIRKYKISGGASYSVKLYLPEGSDDFVIIRK